MEQTLIKLSMTMSVGDFNRCHGMVICREPIFGTLESSIIAITRICPVNPESAQPRLVANGEEFTDETTGSFGPVPINPVTDTYPAYRSFMDSVVGRAFKNLDCEPFIIPCMFDTLHLADTDDSTEIRVEGYNIKITNASGRSALLYV
jgi:hypothetical protein